MTSSSQSDPGPDPENGPGIETHTALPWWKAPVPVPARVLVLLTAAAVFMAVVAWFLGPSGYSRLGQGPVVEISSTVSGPVVDRGAATRPGSFSFTTVNVADVSRASYWTARITHRTENLVHDPPSPLGTLTAKEQMEAARRQAGALAFRLVLGDVPQAGSSVVVASVDPRSPAARAGLLRGDVVQQVDGQVVRDYDHLRELLASATGSVRLQVLRQSASIRIESDLSDGKLGVVVTEILSLRDGVELLDAKVRGVGGPSAGLLLTLAFIDALSPGDLRAGREVAGTGTISLDGNVGAISGIRYKLDAAASTGADVFFLPVANHLDTIPKSLTVVPVRTVFDALQWLCTNGATDAVCANAEAWR